MILVFLKMALIIFISYGGFIPEGNQIRAGAGYIYAADGWEIKGTFESGEDWLALDVEEELLPRIFHWNGEAYEQVDPTTGDGEEVILQLTNCLYWDTHGCVRWQYEILVLQDGLIVGYFDGQLQLL